MNFIAEIAQAHDGSLGLLHSYIDALAQTGITTVKFQTHIASAESSIHEPFRINFSYEDKTRYDYWERMEFTFEQWVEIKNHCENVRLEFMSSPFSIEAFEWLEKLNVKRYKIASGEVNNKLLLNKIAQTGKPIIISSGMSSISELDNTVSYLKNNGNELSILQCTTSYPTPPERIGLNVIKVLKDRYNIPVGISDHSSNINTCIAAAALGAQIFEFHSVFDKRMFGPDSTSSLTIEEIKTLVDGCNYIKSIIDNPIDKFDNSSFENLKNIFEKSLGIRRFMKKGDIITIDDLETKKPSGYGIPASEYEKVIGKKINKNLKKGEFLNWEELI